MKMKHLYSESYLQVLKKGFELNSELNKMTICD